MVERWKPEPTPSAPEIFGAKNVTFIPTGCTLLDCVIAGRSKLIVPAHPENPESKDTKTVIKGGWPIGRVVNIVGDKSTGKTLLAEEAMANFLLYYPKCKVWYRESEAAFDLSYANALGLNTDKIDFGPAGPDTQWNTFEAVMDDINSILEKQESLVISRAKELQKRYKVTMANAEATAYETAEPGLYVIDSLDGVSTEIELKRDIRKGTYNLDKQKLLGELFRKACRRLRRARVCVMIISQTRANIGAAINARQYTRSGGKALDFYASVVIYLADLGKVHRTVNSIKRPIALHVKAKNDKNKISMPYRECEFDVCFGYGIEDDGASIAWLKSIDKMKAAGFDEAPKDLDDVDSNKLRENVQRIWLEIEDKFKPPRGKYATVE